METGLHDFALRAICLAAVDLARDAAKEARRDVTAAQRDNAAAEAARRRAAAKEERRIAAAAKRAVAEQEAARLKLESEIERLTATIAALRVKAREAGGPHRLAAIASAVECATGVSIAALRGRSRRQLPARARMLAMYLARELTPLSLPQIGLYFDRDHTTVLHACRAIEAATGKEAARRDRVMALLKAALADASGGRESER